MNIFESNAARVALMYRLPTLAGSPRTLLVTSRSPLAAVGWDGDVVTHGFTADLQGLGGFADASFERVVLHWVLDDAGTALGRWCARDLQRSLLWEAKRLLVPGGLVTGCVANQVDISALRKRGRAWGSSSADLERLLTRAGFTQPRTFVALPSADAAVNLVSTDPMTARRFFRAQLARRVDIDGRLGSMVRRTLNELGVSRHLQGSLVFSGHAPC